MKKSNVTSINGGARAQRQASSARGVCSPPLNDERVVLTDDELIGWLIYRSDTNEFFHSHRAAPGFTTNAYTSEPCFAFIFATEQKAFKFSCSINKPTEVVPLFDFQDKLIVGFSKQ